MTPTTLRELFADVLIIDDAGPPARDDVVRRLVERLAEAGCVNRDDVAELVRRVLARERLGSTGIGQGLAFPHAKHAGLERRVAALAIVLAGIDFDSLDGEPAHIVILV